LRTAKGLTCSRLCFLSFLETASSPDELDGLLASDEVEGERARFFLLDLERLSRFERLPRRTSLSASRDEDSSLLSSRSLRLPMPPPVEDSEN